MFIIQRLKSQKKTGFVTLLFLENCCSSLFNLSFDNKKRRQPTSDTKPTRHDHYTRIEKPNNSGIVTPLFCLYNKLCIIRLSVSRRLLFNTNTATLYIFLNNVCRRFLCLFLSYSAIRVYFCSPVFVLFHLSLYLSRYFCTSYCLRRIKTF